MNGRNRRRKDVPFNPFAQNAAAERNRRHAEKAKEKRRQDNQNQINSADAGVTNSSKKKSLEDLQREARKKMGSDIKPLENNNDLQSVKSPVDEKPIQEQVITPKITQTTATKSSVEKKPSREERLAELKRKSQQSKDNAKLRKTSAKQEAIPKVELTEELEEVNQTEVDISKSDLDDDIALDDNLGKNLNKQKIHKSSAGISKKKRKSRRMDKKGGGRQRLEKKLNKQKILEFRYVARDILNDPDVPEEHRSNVLGQIIAKGERISIDAAIEFIDQKTLELVITEEISDKLKHEIKSISKRR